MPRALVCAVGLWLAAAAAFAQQPLTAFYVPIAECADVYFVDGDGLLTYARYQLPGYRYNYVPGGTYTVVCRGVENGVPAIRVAANIVVLSGAARVDVTPPPTRHTVRLSSVERHGVRLPVEREIYSSIVAIGFPGGGNRIVRQQSDGSVWRVSDIPPELTFEAFEMFGDDSTNDYYALQHETQHGVLRDLELVNTLSRLRPTEVTFRDPRGPLTILTYPVSGNPRRWPLLSDTDDFTTIQHWRARPAETEWRGTLWTTTESDGVALASYRMYPAAADGTPLIRIVPEGAIVGGDESGGRGAFVPAGTPVRFGEPPYSFTLSAGGTGTSVGASSRFRGGLDEVLDPGAARISIVDVMSQPAHEIAVFAGARLPTQQLTPGRYAVMLSTDSLEVGGLRARSLAVATFDTRHASDRSAPTLTSVRLVDAAGAAVSVVRGIGTSLQFVGDDIGFASLQPATRVSWRPHGASEWRPLPIAEMTTLTGDTTLFRVDLSTLSNGPVDMRIELADGAGNTALWEGTPAFVVDMRSRGRAVRK